MRLPYKMILFICTLLFVTILLMGQLFTHMLTSSIEEQIGERALRVAQTVASIPAVRDAFDDKEPSRVIQPIAEEIRAKTGAEYVVVGNREGIRYSHPIPDRIGKEMVGGDNGPVLDGKAIISKAVGSLGPALRGKAPIFGKNGQVIGVVSVGFLMEKIDDVKDEYNERIILITACSLLLGTGGAILIARMVKRAILGLEPDEIAALYVEKQAILESIREGIIAINRQGAITMINQAAGKILQLPGGIEVIGRHILDVLPESRLLEVMRSGQSEFDRQMWIGDQEIIANRIPVYNPQRQAIGAVASFRSKSEIYRLGKELSRVKEYAEALRAQTHEFSNKLYAISGLIQLESYQEAIDMITRQSDIHQNLIQFIMKEIPDPMIGGLLIGKYNLAQELKVDFEIDRESSFRDVPADVDRDLLMTIIGNLVDNAIEAVQTQAVKQVKVFFMDLGNDLIIECEDNGPGIPDEYRDRIFEQGFSTKGEEQRGFGLFLVRRAVSILGGSIIFTRNEEGGTVFTVALPKCQNREPRSDQT
ncbi:PAS domain-containing protein [Cohnella sp. CFH 77786]|nr:PAS domain-containing protein [Cohnella sp. CFH 77786]